MALTKEIENRIVEIFKKFLSDRVKTINNIRIEDLNINPFLIRLLASGMDFHNSHSIIRWLITQRSMTGANTSFGFALQEVAKLFSEGSGIEGADIMKTKVGRHYHIQVKSGPSTMDKDAVQHMSQLLLSVQRRNRGSVALLGMCYGTEDQVMSTVKKYSDVDWLVGRNFWNFISDDPDCIDEIYHIAAEVGVEFNKTQDQTISNTLENKVQELAKEFEKMYCKSGNNMWRNLLNGNS